MSSVPTPNARVGARIALLVACALLAALVIPGGASAKRGIVTGLSGPDDYQSPDPAARNLWFNRTVDAQAGIVRLGVSWRAVAPTARPLDPTNPASYDLTALDGAVRDAAARGLTVLITVNSAPDWAQGADEPSSATPGAWKPNPADVADFIRAVAARYTGNFDPDGVGPEPPLPIVQALQVWNEPNQDTWLAPQFQGKAIIGPAQYLQILNASYKAIKAVNPRMQVVTGGTSPYGDKPGGPYPPGGARVRPVQWWEKFLCLKEKKSKKSKKGKKPTTKFVRAGGCPGKPLFDVFAHQPIDNTGGGPLAHGPSRFDASTPDLGRVVAVLRAAEKLGTVESGRHPVWVTEFWWDSKPPNPVGAPLLTQARWIEQSLYLFWKAGASTAINFEIRDSLQLPKVHNGYQSGLYFNDGRPKPLAITAFKFPFVTERLNQQKLRAWGKAPESGLLRIQRQQGSRWKNVKKLQVSKGAVFDTTLRLRGKQLLRATVGSSQSVTWKQTTAGARKSSGGGPSGTLIVVLLAGGVALIAAGLALVRRRQMHRLQRHHRARPVVG